MLYIEPLFSQTEFTHLALGIHVCYEYLSWSCMQIVSVGFRLFLWVEFVRANDL
jgi:hypothetical protein